MMAAANDKGLVDLAILDRGLQDIMITDYPRKITEEQYYLDTSDRDAKVYRFLNLEKQALLDFLEDYKDKYEYEVLRSSDGMPIVINKIKTLQTNYKMTGSC